MNQAYGSILAYIFFLVIGLFNVVAGISFIRNRNRSTFWGIVRLLLGLAMLIIFSLFFTYLRKAGLS